jgi:SAM-dependent methyltransferase
MKTEDVHDTVKRAYTEALHKAQEAKGSSGCCGPQPVACCAELVDYGESREKFGDAATSSFGCGNPLAFNDVQPGQTVVDLGSGAGLDLLIAADAVGPEGRVIGVDMTDVMIAKARENAERAGKANIEVRQGQIEALPVEDGSADWVISNCVINLSPNKPKVFAEVARVLRPGGRFSISDIVVEELPEVIRQSAAAYSACIAGAISEEDYLAGLRAAGLTDVEVTERQVYDAAQLRGMVGSDLEIHGFDPKLLDGAVESAAGKVWSAKVTGRRP